MMCRSFGWALACSVLVLVYPADTMQLAFRGLHINVSVALFLLATCLQVAAHDLRNRAAAVAMAAGGAVLLLASILMYEAAIALLPFPLLVLVAREGVGPALQRVRQRPEAAALWLAAAVVFVAYAWMVSSGRATYQGSVAGPSVTATLAGTWAKLFSVGALRSLLGGWYDAAGMLRHEFSRYGYLALATLACCGTVAVLRSAIGSRAEAVAGENVGEVRTRSALRMAACGFVLLLLGYAPFLVSPAHLAITQRTYLFATPGAAFVVIALLVWIAGRTRAAAALSFAALTLLGLASQLFQFQQYVTISEHQRTLLRGIVESAPPDLGQRTLVVLDGSNRLNHTWMLRDNIALALSYLYAKPVTNVEICLSPSRAWQRLDGLGRPGECLQDAAGWRFRRAAPVGGPGVPPATAGPDVVVAAADAVVVTIREDGSPEPQEALDAHRRLLATGSGDMERRYRGFLLPQAPSRLVQQFTRVRETGSYRTDFGRWWSIEEPIHGSGWREADWTIGSFRHDAGSWSVTPTSSLVFEVQPRGRAGRMSGHFDAMAGGREGFQLRLNGHPVAARWADERRFDADLPAGMLLDGRNVLEVSARPAPDYYGLGAKMTWLQVDAR
jgi:hypothetical protein